MTEIDEVRVSVLVPRKYADTFKYLAREFRLEQRCNDHEPFWECIWWIAHRSRCTLEDGYPQLSNKGVNK